MRGSERGNVFGRGISKILVGGVRIAEVGSEESTPEGLKHIGGGGRGVLDRAQCCGDDSTSEINGLSASIPKILSSPTRARDTKSRSV